MPVRWDDIDPPTYAESTSTDQNSQSRRPGSARHHGILKKTHHTCRDHEYHTNHVEYLKLPEYSILPSRTHLKSESHREYLSFSTEDVYYGKEVHVTFIKWHLDGRKTTENLSISVPPNCPDGTVYVFDGAGHQLRNGQCQDMYFIVGEEHDDGIFHREGNNLYAFVLVPWTSKLETQVCSFHVEGPDGTVYPIEVDYHRTKMTHGITKIRGKGLPVYKGQRKGDLIIE
ncbi:hypothetical protein EST38_g8561 [Candolleomyces aberdarensis]|uniref:Chaperone DnaJ C-terminal domain-containing protein n=1 Tax=Candolleomyces aberdarensis TaxID=2316362 RepID=A0A4Q2DEB2_9AGAR|nr:hypothetical protein EST38_g8561 [Candolleomyces aberdarensis]